MSTIDIVTAWRKGNNAGEGFAPEPVFADRQTTVLEAVQHAVSQGAVLHNDCESDDGIAEVEFADGLRMLIGDSHGAWAVYV